VAPKDLFSHGVINYSRPSGQNNFSTERKDRQVSSLDPEQLFHSMDSELFKTGCVQINSPIVKYRVIVKHYAYVGNEFLSMYLILSTALDSGFYSTSIRNEYQKQKNDVFGEYRAAGA
jgi:hypothetical protein